MVFSPRSFFQRTSRSALSPQRALWALVIIAIVAAMPRFFRWLRHDDEPAILNDPALNSGPAVSARGMEMTERDPNGQRTWYVKARKLEVSLDKRYVIATGLERGVYFRDDKPYLTVTAPRVRFDQTTRDWHAPADFTVHGPDGLVLKSRDATWNNALKTLDCPQRVVAQLKGSTIEASQVTYHAGLNELRSTQPVTLKAQEIEARGASAVADLKNQTVRLKGDIQMKIQPRAVKRIMR